MKLQEETSVEVSKKRSECHGAPARHHKLLVSISHIVKARKERKDKAVATLLNLCKIYNDERKVTVEAHVAKWSDLRMRVESLTNDCGK